MVAESGAYADLTLSGFTEALASAESVPGGGSASAVGASIAASLVVMVARLSLDRPRYAAFEKTHRRAIASAEDGRQRFLQLADQDATAFSQYAVALKMPRDSEASQKARESAVDDAARGAAAVPIQVVRECAALVDLVESLAGRSNLNASSDLEVASLLAQAAARGAGANVITNVGAIADQEVVEALLSEVEARLHEIESGVARVQEQLRSRDLLKPEPV